MALLERSILGFVLIARTCKELARVQLMLTTMQCLKILKPKNNKKNMIQDDLVSGKHYLLNSATNVLAGQVTFDIFDNQNDLAKLLRLRDPDSKQITDGKVG